MMTANMSTRSNGCEALARTSKERRDHVRVAFLDPSGDRRAFDGGNRVRLKGLWPEHERLAGCSARATS
jgi:hypothetical protein